MRVFPFAFGVLIAQFSSWTSARLISVETGTNITISNARLSLTILKSTGAIHNLTLDGQNLLGTNKKNKKTGIGPYLDCYCIKKGAGSYTPGYIAPKYNSFNGSDEKGTPFAGVVMSETLPESGQTLSMFWIVSGEETGIHTFSRVQYPKDPVGPTRQTLQEFRTLFRPNSDLWTHMSVNDELAAPRPRPSTLEKGKVVQDATWDVSAAKDDPFVVEFSDYFTKYTFADAWDQHSVHGLFGRSKKTPHTRLDGLDGTRTDSTEGTWGAWMVMNSKDTFYGGPRHTDLTVDGIVYNYMVSNHRGANAPNLTAGFDKTFGPAYYYFNHGSSNSTLAELRHDAAQFANPTWNLPFYEAISGFVPGYVPPSKRTTFKARISLPRNAKKATVILSADGIDVQDNAAKPNAYQYWGRVATSTGEVSIPMVVPGKYRMTVEAQGVFGDFVLDGVDIGKKIVKSWKEESSGQELWRIGTPDFSAGEFRHGYARDRKHSLAPQEYRIYWRSYDYLKDFPNGVHFRIGESNPAEDWNYVHWSEFDKINTSNWTISWHQGTMTNASSKATLTVQLAAVKSVSGNSHVSSGKEKSWPDLPFTVLVNNQQLKTWNIP
ncbi:rhamnogalacturonate lyase precursor [Venturia nashicola]|nr:rhamnogalacturonate lyase precursor [Venturia nashicola]